MPTSETRINPNRKGSKDAPAPTAAAVPTNAGTIDDSNRIAWETRIQSRVFIAGPRFSPSKRIPLRTPMRGETTPRTLSHLRAPRYLKCSVSGRLKCGRLVSRRVARGYRRKRFYSTANRVLAHLSATASHEPASLSALTQEGIAAATHFGRTTATKSLARMEAAGLVVGERAHVA